MLDTAAFANSLAALMGVLYLVFYFIGVIAPRIFEFLFNAQFFGANVAALLPKRFSFWTFSGTLVALLGGAWVFGYAWAWLYNLLAG